MEKRSKIIKINYTTAKREFDKLKNKFPKKRNPYYKTYQSCRHFNRQGSPSCIVGHILYNLGVRSENFHTEHKGTVQGLSGYYGNADVKIGNVQLTMEAINFLSDIQRKADNDDNPLPWGEL